MQYAEAMIFKIFLQENRIVKASELGLVQVEE
jgi:hypothetical protein